MNCPNKFALFKGMDVWWLDKHCVSTSLLFFNLDRTSNDLLCSMFHSSSRSSYGLVFFLWWVKLIALLENLLPLPEHDSNVTISGTIPIKSALLLSSLNAPLFSWVLVNTTNKLQNAAVLAKPKYWECTNRKRPGQREFTSTLASSEFISREKIVFAPGEYSWRAPSQRAFTQRATHLHLRNDTHEREQQSTVV